MATQTIQFESVSLSEIGSGTLTAYLFSGATLVATLASIAENATLKGRHTGTVTDIPAATYRLVVKFNGYTISEPDEVVTLLLAVGTYVASRPAVLDSAGRTAIAAAVDVKLTAEHGAGSWAGGSGGDNTEVLEAIDSMKSIISEWIALNIPTDVRGFPATIIGGTDVVVSLEVVDSNNDPITEIFGESVETVQWLFGMGTSARRSRILGSVEWVSDLLQITITRAETLDDDDGPRTWMIGCKLTSGELKWVKTGVTRLIGRQFAEPTTTTTGA
jgi:hypothetical protein